MMTYSEELKIPTVTEILNTLTKPNLVVWANKIGLKGIELEDKLITSQNIGKLLHSYVTARIMQQEFIPEGSKDEIETFRVCASKLDRWLEDTLPFRVIMNEFRLYSVDRLFSGQPDLVYAKNGNIFLVDFKTSKKVYLEHKIQISAYKMLLVENGFKVDRLHIVKVSKEPEEPYRIEEVEMPEIYEEIFKLCLDLYYRVQYLEPSETLDWLELLEFS